MSGTEFHRERQELAGNPKANPVNVSINIQKPGSGQTSQTTNTRNVPTEENLKEKTKNVASDTYKKGKSKMEEKTSMISLLRHAQYCLKEFMSPKLNVEKQIPVRILSDAFALVFLTEYKASLGVGSSIGTGLIIARKPNHKGWTGPCGIGMGGVSVGFQAGAQKTEHIIVLRDQKALKSFASQGQLKLGGDMSIAVGPLGRDAEVALNVNDKDFAPIYSYSINKGLHIGASLDGQIIMIRDDCNESYYGKKVSVEDILFDKIDSLPSDEYCTSLTKLIEEYSQKHGRLSENWFTEEENIDDEDEYPEQADLNENEKRQRDEKMDKNKEKKRSKNKMSNEEQMQEDESKKREQRISMDRLLRHARFNLENFMNPKVNPEKQIPVQLLNDAIGLIFLTEFKGGVGIGGSTGTGFIITRKKNEDEFSHPCSIGMGGISIGFQIGGQKTEHILIFRDEEILKKFVTKGELNFGGDMSFSVGPLGRDFNVPLKVDDKGYASIYSYSMANGAYVGVTMESQTLTILDDWNEEYFGKKVTAKDILFGHTKPQSMDQEKSYQDLVNLIKEFQKTKGKLSNDSYWNDQERKEEEYWKSKDISVESQDIKTSKDTQEKEESGNMYRLLCDANCNFEDFVNPNLTIEKQIPIRILSGAHAIVFLTEIKAGFLVGASLGRGIILARKDKGWTGPCAISVGGMSVGWLAGAEKTEHIIVLRDESVLQTFLSKGQLKLGGDFSFAIGPLGRDANIAVNVNDKGYAPIYSYSMSKGAYMGASLEGHLITIRDNTNEEYYGKKVKSSDILHGLVEPLEDNEYKKLCENLDKYMCLKDETCLKDTKLTNKPPDETHIVSDVHIEKIYHKNTDEIEKHKENQNM